MIPLNVPLSTPLRVDHDEVIRVGQSRVTLDTIVARFHQGDSAEQIVHDFPVLDLADIYDVIAFYLRHQPDVDEYLRLAQQEGDAIRKEWEQKSSAGEIRARLLLRHKKGENTGAEAGEQHFARPTLEP